MAMTASRPAAPAHQRARGGAELHFRRSGAATRIAHLFQASPARILFPTPDPGEAPLAALVNTAGGLAGGDSLRFDLRLGPGAVATLSTPAAEKVYRSLGPATRIDVEMEVGAGATLEWLPQETILFDGARLERRIAVSLAPDARLLFAEMLVFGRRARGEVMQGGLLRDAWRLSRGGALVWADGLALAEDLAERRADRFGFGGAEAMASLVLAAPEPLTPLRDALREAGAAASLIRPGLLLARWLGDAVALRDALGAAICLLRARALGQPARLPRLWTS
ncbi:urease accessory protein UreD [Roseomonas rosulenta]|uniref:urease accessory protein UreD n=1 Tax=Roseomonas rosulenta TaxID=2748667 RepID=UPI001E41B3B9|nr:urease accessory protein UreD [Roseomonas rosulenta]